MEMQGRALLARKWEMPYNRATNGRPYIGWVSVVYLSIAQFFRYFHSYKKFICYFGMIGVIWRKWRDLYEYL